jgi:hypothetical protein
VLLLSFVLLFLCFGLWLSLLDRMGLKKEVNLMLLFRIHSKN